MNSPQPERIATAVVEPRRRDTGALVFLADLSRSLAVSLDLRQTLTQAITRVRDFLEVEGIALFLLDPASQVLECQVSAGPIDVTGMRLAVGQGIVGQALAQDATQIVADAGSDARVWRGSDEASGFVTRSLVCAPLRTAAGPIGVIEIVNRSDGTPFTAADAELLELVAAPAALAINNARMAGELLEQQRLKRELDLARHLQKSLLPRRRRDGFPVLGVNRPAHEMSGDFYDYFELTDGSIGFLIGDISGKGLDAALLMMRAASLLRWIGKERLAPAAWLARANEELCDSAREGRFVCAVVGYCDRAARHVRFASAGFPPVLVHSGGQYRQYLADGPPLGIVREAQFTEHALALDGGTLYAFSDGATDVRGSDGKPIGMAGLLALIQRHAQATPKARLRSLLGELRRLHLVDDTTFLLIEAAQVERPQLLFSDRMPARADAMRGLRTQLRAAFDREALEPRLRDELVLAVDEACTNVIRHGYGPACEGPLEVRATRCAAMLTLEIIDEAPAIDPASFQPGTLGECRCGGLGIALIDRIMDDWRIEPAETGRGNRLVLRKHIEAWASEEAEEA